MTLDRVVLVGLKDGDATSVRLNGGLLVTPFKKPNELCIHSREFGSVEASVHAVGVERHVETRNLGERIRTEAVIAVQRFQSNTNSCGHILYCHSRVKVGSPRLDRVITSVMSNSLLKTKLIDNSLALELDVVQPHTGVSGKGKVK